MLPSRGLARVYALILTHPYSSIGGAIRDEMLDIELLVFIMKRTEK